MQRATERNKSRKEPATLERALGMKPSTQPSLDGPTVGTGAPDMMGRGATQLFHSRWLEKYSHPRAVIRGSRHKKMTTAGLLKGMRSKEWSF